MSATASHRNGALAVTVINRHRHTGAGVHLTGMALPAANGPLLTAAMPDAAAPLPLAVDGSALRGKQVERPPFSMATLVFVHSGNS